MGIGIGYLIERVECLWNGKLKFFRSNCLLYNILLGPTTSWKLPLPPPLRSRQYARTSSSPGPTSALPCAELCTKYLFTREIM
jgi:hypothetical protein